MRFFEHGQTVVDRVAGGEAGALETEAGEQDVGFDDVFQRHRDDVGFAGGLGLQRIFEQRFVASSLGRPEKTDAAK